MSSGYRVIIEVDGGYDKETKCKNKDEVIRFLCAHITSCLNDSVDIIKGGRVQ